MNIKFVFPFGLFAGMLPACRYAVLHDVQPYAGLFCFMAIGFGLVALVALLAWVLQ